MEDSKTIQEDLEKNMQIKISYKDYVFAAFFAAACALVIWRAFYGLDWTDESYYLAVTKRFFQGDRPFREEWFTTQLIGVLLLPLYSLYHGVTGGTEGILLFMRLCYVGFSAAVSLLAYVCLVREENLDRVPAALFALSSLFYVRANIPTLSYYSIGLGCFLIYLLLRGKPGVFRNISAGVAFAVSTVCMPYMALYFAVTVVGKVYRSVRVRRINREDIWILTGIVLSAAVFLIYCAGSGNAGDILTNLPEVLEDPEHQSTLTGSVFSFLKFMITVFYQYLFWPQVLLSAGIIWSSRRKGNHERIKKLLKAEAYLLFFVQAVYLRTFFEGGILIAFVFLAVQVSLLNGWGEKKLWRRYALPGLIFGVIWVLGSNVGQRVFNMGSLAACIWAFPVVWRDASESSGRWIRTGKYLAMLATVGILLVIRLFDIYRDEPVECLTERLESGAGKGLYTTPERASEYESVLECLKKYAGEDRLLAVGGTNPWIYLEAEAECGVFAAWNVDFEDPRNEIYYERYPEKLPDVIFLLEPEYGRYEAWRYSSHGGNDTGYGVEELSGYFKTLVDIGYQCYEEACGKFFVMTL